jgi:hypothetical protein
MSIRSLALGGIIPWTKSEPKLTAVSTVRRPTIISSRTIARPGTRTRSRLNLASAVPWLSFLAGFAVIAASGLYLFSINMYAAKGYDLKKQQALVRELTAKQQQLIIKQAEVGSIAQLNSAATAEQLVQITDEEFIQPKELSVR